jgi:hypothetical protein
MVLSKLRTLLEALQLEIGSRGNPLEENYSWFGHLATDTWLSALWERIWTYNFELHLNYQTLPLPRESDIKITEILVGQWVRGKAMASLNRCRLAHKAIFLPCISTADGTHIDRQYLAIATKQGRTSLFLFPREEPINDNWKCWEAFWCDFCDNGLRLQQTLRRWRASGHRI